jgi:hypothetical protein
LNDFSIFFGFVPLEIIVIGLPVAPVPTPHFGFSWYLRLVSTVEPRRIDCPHLPSIIRSPENGCIG